MQMNTTPSAILSIPGNGDVRALTRTEVLPLESQIIEGKCIDLHVHHIDHDLLPVSTAPALIEIRLEVIHDHGGRIRGGECHGECPVLIRQARPMVIDLPHLPIIAKSHRCKPW